MNSYLGLVGKKAFEETEGFRGVRLVKTGEDGMKIG